MSPDRLFDEPLEIERGYVGIEVNDREVSTEHRVTYDHDPPVELRVTDHGVMMELAVDWEFGGRIGRARASIPNEQMRKLIIAAAPRVGVEVGEGSR